MKRWIGILLCTALSISGKLEAQTCSLKRTVLDPSGPAVEGADVVLQAAAPEQTTTDRHGSFVFHCAGDSPYNIAVHGNGFAESQVNGRVPANITVSLRIAEVHTVVEGGENSGVSVDADH